MKKLYKVLYGDFMSQRVVAEFISLNEAKHICNEYDNDPWMICTITEHEEDDYKKILKQERKQKLETIWKKQMNGK